MVQILRPIKIFKVLSEDYFFMGFEMGDFDIYKVEQSSVTDTSISMTRTKKNIIKVFMVKSDKSKEHEGSLTSVDYNP